MIYNEYGFGNNAQIYSLNEENRDFRKKIQNDISSESDDIQELVTQHVTDETNRTISKIDTNTVQIREDIQSVEQKVDENKSLLDMIWEKVSSLRSAIIG
jgi:uncharacterized coiled-coil DUF342 family protein